MGVGTMFQPLLFKHTFRHRNCRKKMKPMEKIWKDQTKKVQIMIQPKLFNPSLLSLSLQQREDVISVKKKSQKLNIRNKFQFFPKRIYQMLKLAFIVGHLQLVSQCAAVVLLKVSLQIGLGRCLLILLGFCLFIWLLMNT